MRTRHGGDDGSESVRSFDDLHLGERVEVEELVDEARQERDESNKPVRRHIAVLHGLTAVDYERNPSLALQALE